MYPPPPLLMSRGNTYIILAGLPHHFHLAVPIHNIMGQEGHNDTSQSYEFWSDLAHDIQPFPMTLTDTPMALISIHLDILTTRHKKTIFFIGRDSIDLLSKHVS